MYETTGNEWYEVLGSCCYEYDDAKKRRKRKPLTWDGGVIGVEWQMRCGAVRCGCCDWQSKKTKNQSGRRKKHLFYRTRMGGRNV